MELLKILSISCIISFMKLSSQVSGNTFCWELPGISYKCPHSTKTYLQCYGRKIPIGKGASSTDIWTTLTLLVLPGDQLRCTVHCRTKVSGKVTEENCHERLFNFKADRGIIKDFEKGEPSSFHFYYEADRDIKKLSDKETTVNLSVFLKEVGSDPVISGGNVQIVYPPLVGTRSTLKCPFNYVRFRSKMDCRIEPKAQEGRVIPASPFEFDVKLSSDSNKEFGDFSSGSYLTISPDEAEKDLLSFQYEAANRQGCNYIWAGISNNIPNYAEVGNQITNSPYKICTVGGNEVSLRGRVWYSIPVVVLAVAHSIKSLF